MKTDKIEVKDVRNPAREALEKYAEQVGKLIQPDWLDIAEGGDSHGGHGLVSKRVFTHRGHEVSIKTTYEITIDDKPYAGHVSVDEEGHIRCHSIPYETYPSAVDFVKQLIDQYPRSFPAPCAKRGES